MVDRFERWLVGAGGVLFLGFSLGCMSLNFGSRTEVVSAVDAPGIQRGKAHVRAGGDQVVYYPTPYTTPPNLELEDGALRDSLQIVEQRNDSFVVKNTSASSVDVSWKARGAVVGAPAQPTLGAPASNGQPSPQISSSK